VRRDKFFPGGNEEPAQARKHQAHTWSLWPGGHFPFPYSSGGGKTRGAIGTELNPFPK